jgi:hypothetical protein
VPFKQTIVTDPVTGKQTMKMEGAVEDFTAANPMTPTVSAPVAPEMGPPRDAMMQEQYVGTPGFNPAAAPVTFSDIRGQEVEMQPQVGGQPTMPASAPVAPTATAPTMEGVMAGPPTSAMMPPAAPVAATGAPQKSQAQLELERRQAQQPTTAPTAEGLAMGPSMADAQPEAYTSKIEAAKNNPQALAALNADTRAPDWVRSLAAEELGNTILRQRQEQQAGKKFNDIVQNQGRGFERAMRDSSEEGSVFRAYLYQRFGLNDLAKQEQQKLGAGDSWQQVIVNDQPLAVKFNADGQAKVGYYTSGELAGQAVDDKTLLSAMGNRSLGKGATVSSEVYVDKTTGQRYRSGVDNSGRTALVNVQGGASYRGDPRNLEVQSIGTSIAKAEGAKAVDLRYAGPIAYTKAGADFAGKFNAENGTNIGYQSQTPGAPLVDLNTGQRVVPNANGTITATTRTGGTTTTATGVAPTTGVTPAQIKTQTAVSEASQKVFAEKRIPEIIDEGSQGGDVARIRREQLDTIRDNPSILSIYQGRGDNYDRARNVITNVISGAYGEENSGKLRDDLKAISISPAEKAALENFANLNMQINTKTLKANTGGGQISGAEQKINKETNLSDIASQTPLASMQGLHRSMFVGDLNSAKASFLTANPNFNTDAAFASAWSKKKSEATRAYEGIMRERAEFLKPYAPPRDASPAQITAFNERVFKAFEMYPAPRWDSENNRWNYQTKNAELAAARALGKR